MHSLLQYVVPDLQAATDSELERNAFIQDSGLSFFVDYQNILITGGTFVEHYHHPPDFTTELERNAIHANDFLSSFFADHSRVTIYGGAFESRFSSDLDSIIQATKLQATMEFNRNPPDLCSASRFTAGAKNILISDGNFRYLPHSNVQAAKELERNASTQGFFSRFFAYNENLAINGGTFEYFF